MKKILILAVSAFMLLTGTDVFAQFSVSGSYSKGTDSYDLTSVTLGASYNFHSVNGIGFAPGLYYSCSMDSQKEQSVNLPMMFNYGREFVKGIGGFAYAGPTLSVDTYQKNLDIKSFNASVGGGIGLVFAEHYAINAGYDFGLIDRSKDDGTLHSNKFNFGFTYIF
ncbi:MAG: outer membrane beta-barrel protein [Bacteroidales bacterium]